MYFDFRGITYQYKGKHEINARETITLWNDLEMNNKTLEQQKIIGSLVGLKWFQINFLIINNNWIFRSLYAYEKDNKVVFLHWMSYLSIFIGDILVKGRFKYKTSNSTNSQVKHNRITRAGTTVFPTKTGRNTRYSGSYRYLHRLSVCDVAFLI